MWNALQTTDRYVGEEFEQQTLTPNFLIRGKPANFPVEYFDTLDDTSDVTRRLCNLKTCRKTMGKEYLRTLEERSKTLAIANKKVPTEGSIH